MSGIVGLWHRDNSPADRDLLRALTQFLSFRGPDSCETWSEGEIALGHAELRTSASSNPRHQPATLEGIFTVVADARLDARDDLVRGLSGDQSQPTHVPSDAELIARCYAKWGEHCVSHLAGDFSFAIWDARERKLFCARDHFGVRPFYYAEFDDQFLFSNTLDCIRLHPEFSEELDEEAIGDFLLFGLNLNPATTAFRQIRRLPPAHCMAVSDAGIRVRKFWTPPVDGRLRYTRPQDYVEHFQSVLSQSVRDRLEGERVGILLSGGLDSSSLAATAREIARHDGSDRGIRAYTVVSAGSGEDPELSLARETASFLGLRHEVIRLPALEPFDRNAAEEFAWPEPVDDPFFAGLFHQFRQIARDCHILLDGEGSDNLMHFEMWPYVKDMMRRREWRELFSTMPSYLRRRGSIWPGIQRRIREAGGNNPDERRYPEWLNPEFAARTGLKDRLRNRRDASEMPAHPLLPKAHAALTLPHWAHLFENENAGVTRAPVEVRFPYLDLRVVNFLLSLPPYPWVFRKTILREAMLGKLPERVRKRPKTSLRGDPLAHSLGQPLAEYARRVKLDARMERFVQREILMKQLQNQDTLFLPLAIRPICFNFWLQSCSVVRYKLKAEAHNG